MFVSGQIPADASGTLLEGSIADKTAMCCKNIEAILKSAGSEIGKVVKVNVRHERESSLNPLLRCLPLCVSLTHRISQIHFDLKCLD